MISLQKRQRGFTIVELLIVIVIIGILATLVIVTFTGTQQRARDTQRKKDLLQIQTGIELYRSDVGAYPAALPNCGSSLSNGATVYMQKFPCDPLPGAAWGTTYKYSGNANAYTLYACLENANDSEKDTTKQGGCSSANASHTVISP